MYVCMYVCMYVYCQISYSLVSASHVQRPALIGSTDSPIQCDSYHGL